MGSPPPPETLLERRRREMREAIRRASVRLMTEVGIGRVTVEAVSAAVGISPRTFFNYFPNKEAALAQAPPPLPPARIEAFAATTGAPGALLDELGELLAEHLDSAPPDRSALSAVLAAARQHPPLMALHLARLEDVEGQLRDLLARRIGDADPDAPELLAAVAMGAVRVAMQRWSRDDGSTSPGTYVRDSFAALRRWSGAEIRQRCGGGAAEPALRGSR